MAKKTSPKKIVITGGAGYIGNTLIAALPQDVEIVVIDSFHIDTPFKRQQNEILQNSRTITLIEANVAEVEKYRHSLKNVDAVVYMASLNSHRDSDAQPLHYLQENALHLQLFLDAVHKESPAVQKMVLTSSRGVYGEGVYTCVTCGGRVSPEPAEALVCPLCSGSYLTSQPLKETDPVNPSSYYGLTKKLQEDLLRQYCLKHRIPLDILRIFNVYGEDQENYYSHIGIIPMMHALIREKGSIQLAGNGNLTRDFIHVNDVVSVITQSLYGENSRKQLVEIYNLGSGQAMSITDLADFFADAGYAFLRNPVPAYGDVRYSIADHAKAKEAFHIESFSDVNDFLNRQYTPEARALTL